MGAIADFIGTLRNSFRIGRGTLSTAALTVARAFSLPDRAGALALDAVPVRTLSASGSLSNADHGSQVLANSASAITVTIPSGLRSDFACIVRREGTGAVTIAAGSGTTQQPSATPNISAQYKAISITGVGGEAYRLDGALA